MVQGPEQDQMPAREVITNFGLPPHFNASLNLVLLVNVSSSFIARFQRFQQHILHRCPQHLPFDDTVVCHTCPRRTRWPI